MEENEKRVLELAKAYRLCDLPIGAYVTAKNGKLVACNNRARKMLGIGPNGLPDASIADFYEDPSRKDKQIKELEQAEKEGKCVEERAIHFKVRGQERFLHDYCRSMRDPETKQFAGYVGCLVDVAEEEDYHRLFQRLPIAFYRLDANDRIVDVNPAAVKMLGYNSANDLVDRPVGDLYATPEDAQALQTQTIEKGFVTNEKVELVKNDGEHIFVSVHASKDIKLDGSYDGRAGTMMDVTVEEYYRRTLDEIRVGFYAVRVEGGKDIVQNCNKGFLDIFEFDKMEDALGFDMKDSYRTNEDHLRFIEEIRTKDSQNQPLLGYAQKVRTRKGKTITIEVNCRLQHDRNGNIIGRAGVVRDITQEAAVADQLKELTEHIGRVLHNFSSTLILEKGSLAAVIETLARNPFDKEKMLSPEHAAEAIREPASGLVRSLGRLLEVAKNGDRSAALPPEKWSRLSALSELLQGLEEIPYLEIRPSTARMVALEVSEIGSGITEEGRFPREILRQVQRDAWALMRICSLIALYQAKDAVIAIDHQVRAIREYVTSGVRQEEPKAVRTIGELIGRAVSNVDEFAKNQGVEIRFRIGDPNVQVEVVERDVVRALANLLHNAIKYSWKRNELEPPWISISSRIVQSEVWIQFENWGVSLPRDELDSVFQLGFRGRMSSDRGRVGTGVGLVDALRVAQKHGGTVTIVSNPAAPGGKTDDYSQPFRTTATLKLPIFSRKEGKK